MSARNSSTSLLDIRVGRVLQYRRHLSLTVARAALALETGERGAVFSQLWADLLSRCDHLTV